MDDWEEICCRDIQERPSCECSRDADYRRIDTAEEEIRYDISDWSRKCKCYEEQDLRPLTELALAEYRR